MTALPSETELDAYTILRVLGEGGFGVTYLAEDRKLGLRFAIKEYFPQSWASREETDSASLRPNSASRNDYDWGLARFIEEAKTLARFRHPAIMRVTRIIEVNNTAYMVLDYEEGDDFGTWLKKLGRPPTQAELDAILVPLLEALSLIHRNNILHRDIAPDNLYIRADGSPVLLDFGSAREAMGHRTRTLSAIIKSGYSPQEQYTTDGKDQGPWTDIYALGATLYRAVTGEAPPEATRRAIEDDLVPAAKAAKGDYRRSFLAAIDHALQRHHKQRPRRIQEWRKELLGDEAETGAGRASAASAPSGDEQPGRKLAQKAQESAWPRHAAWWAAALVLIALLGGAGYYLGVVRPAGLARQQQHDAKQQKQRLDDLAWDKAKREDTVSGFRAYIAARPQGKHVAEARARIAKLERAAAERRDDDAFAKASRAATIAAYRRYLRDYPEGRHVAQAKARIEKLRQLGDAAWETAKRRDTIDVYRAYIKAAPDGPHIAAARARIAELERAASEREQARRAPPGNDFALNFRDNTAWLEAERVNTRSAYLRYLSQFPNGRHAAQARARIGLVVSPRAPAAPRPPSESDFQDSFRDNDAWLEAEKENTRAAYTRYLELYPSGRHAAEARARINSLPARDSARRKAWLGVRIQNVTDEIANSLGLSPGRNGVLVTEVSPGSAAEKAGLKIRDVIHMVDSTEIRDAAGLSRHIQEFPPGRTVALTITRDGKSRTIAVTLGQRP